MEVEDSTMSGPPGPGVATVRESTRSNLQSHKLLAVTGDPPARRVSDNGRYIAKSASLTKPQKPTVIKHAKVSSSLPLAPPPVIMVDTEMTDSQDEAGYSAVTQEARRVLDQFLKRCLSQNDASPYARAQRASNDMGLVPEPVFEHTMRSDSYTQAQMHTLERVQSEVMATEESIVQTFASREFVTQLESMDVDEDGVDGLPWLPEKGDGEVESPEPDYVYTHSLVSKKNSLSSQSSGGGHDGSPLHKIRGGGVSSRQRHQRSCSTTSTEDYEYVDNEFIDRKKKSFFRWASERLRESFRRKKENADFGLESPKEEVRHPSPQKLKKKKKSKLRLNLRRSASDKSKSSSTANDAAAVPTAAEMARSEKDKGIWESFLKSIRKGGFKLKRKGSKERQKSRSADNLVIRPLSREHERLLQRYVDHHPTERDVIEEDGEESEYGTVRSLHEVTSHHVNQGGAVRGLADPVLVRCQSQRNYRSEALGGASGDSKGARGHMRLEGLVKYQPSQPAKRLDTSSRIPSAGCPGQLSHGDSEGRPVGRPVIRPPVDPGDVFTDTDTGLDDLDGVECDLRDTITSAGIPFSERTEYEKEELYEKIAQQLATIAEHYSLSSPLPPGLPSTSSESHEPASTSTTTSVATVGDLSTITSSPLSQASAMVTSVPPQDLTSPTSQHHTQPAVFRAPLASEEAVSPDIEELPYNYQRHSHSRGRKVSDKLLANPSLLEQKLGALLRQKGDSTVLNNDDPTPVVVELVRNASYSKFQQVVRENIGSEPGWQQLAVMFRLTQTAVQFAGMGTAVALQIKEMTLQYFEDRFAKWIIGQGGWESVVEDTNTEVDSELD